MNVMSHNAAGVDFLYEDFLEFTCEIQHENKLVTAGFNMDVRHFLAGCRARGLTCKLVT